MNFFKIDNNFRYFISLLFRLLITVYAVFIINRNDNYFSTWITVVAFVLYWIIFLSCFSKDKFFPKIRFVNDYIFIAFILYHKNLNSIENSIFLFLPIVNSFNHTAKRNILFTILLYTVPVSLYILNYEKCSSLEIIIPVVALFSINTFFSLRSIVINFNESLNQSFEKYYSEGNNVGRSHHILKNFKSIHQEESIIKIFVSINEVVCFRITENKLYLINSSKFIINWKLNDDLQKLINTQTAEERDVKIKIDNWDTSKNVFYKINLEEDAFGFLVIFDKKPIFPFYELYAQKILFPVLKRMGRVLIAESDIKFQRKKLMDSIKTKIEHIDLTANAIHFLNNKLNPLSLYFQLEDELAKINKKSEIYSEVEQLKEQAYKEAKSNFIPALDRINIIMDKSKNPFAIEEFEEVKLQRLFVTLRQMLQKYDLGDPDNVIDFQWDYSDLERTINTNITFFEFVLEEVFINMQKYNSGEVTIGFVKENEAYLLKFTNNIKAFDIVKKENIERIIKEFNNENMSEIMRRGVKGIRFLKQYLQQLDFAHSAELIGDKFVLKVWLC